jgi:hypothetical protein
MTDLPGASISGDASVHLEEILGDLVVAPQAGHDSAGRTLLVEIVGPHLRLSGKLNLGSWRRITDLVNNQDGLFRITDAVVLRRSGEPTKVSVPDLWVSPGEVTLIAEVATLGTTPAPEFMIPKRATGLIIVTPGHTVTGEVYIPELAQLSVFIESSSPPFIPMTTVRTRSLADRRVRANYAFAALNRKHIVAASPLPEHFVGDRGVI